MVLLEKIKRDITRNRGKAAVLGALVVVMIAFTVRAVIQLRPAEGAANPIAMDVGNDIPSDGTDGAQAEARIKESQELWGRLREVNASVSTSVAFAFDSSYYPDDPTRKPPVVVQPDPVPQVVPVTPTVDPEVVRRAREAAIRDEARSLKVSLISISSKSCAVVNNEQLALGDQILGFEVSAIRTQEVEFTKKGVTIAVKMSGP